ncbi:MAG: polyprenyl synthetase family protein, partial [Acidimicrobiales bacterium]
REGKPTALVAIARQRAGGAAARLLAERLGAPDLTATEVAEVQSVLVETGARAEVEDEVDALVSQALVALDKAPLTPEAAAELRELAGFIAGRGY